MLFWKAMMRALLASRVMLHGHQRSADACTGRQVQVPQHVPMVPLEGEKAYRGILRGHRRSDSAWAVRPAPSLQP